jgi:agmatinase
VSDPELFVSQSNVFAGFQKPFEKSDYVVYGVPFDVTSTYRTGARFGPTAIRQASLNIETYSFRSGVDLEDLMLHDLGDLHVSADTEKTLEMLEQVTKDILKVKKVPVAIGGEHTITLGIARGLGAEVSKTGVVSFDAHLDTRDEYMGLRLSHTTFMRRISEEIRPRVILEVGTRAVCKEELDYAQRAGIKYFTTYDIKRNGASQTIECLRKALKDCSRIYLSVDMDVLDPAFVPAAQNPESEGLDPYTLLDILANMIDKRMVGFDVLEIAPEYDQGISAVQAARVIFEILCYLEKARTTR